MNVSLTRWLCGFKKPKPPKQNETRWVKNDNGTVSLIITMATEVNPGDTITIELDPFGLYTPDQ